MASLRILIVEDSQPWRRAIRSILQESSDLVVICECSDGLEAIQKSEQLQPDLVVLDIGLPKVNGFEVLEKIRSDENLKMIPVVVLTSSHEERDLVQSYKLGVNAYVVKPVDFHQFVNAVKELGVFWAVINQPPPGSVKKR